LKDGSRMSYVDYYQQVYYLWFYII
jgi:hypothetical protein